MDVRKDERMRKKRVGRGKLGRREEERNKVEKKMK